MLYKGFFDAFIKVSSKEGVFGLYKGWLASYCRIGPHNVRTPRLTYTCVFSVCFEGMVS